MNRVLTAQNTNSANISGVVSFTLSLLFFGLSGLLIANSVRSVTTAYKRSKLLDQAQSEVNELRLRNLELLQKKEMVTGEAYVENEARDRIMYAKEGEVMLVLPEAAGETVKEDVEGVTDIVDSSPAWVDWWSVLREGV